MNKASAKIDTLLEPLLLASSDDRSDELLAQLISEHVEPVIRRVIRYKLHFSTYDATGRAEADDLYQESVLQVLGELRRLRDQPDGHPIGDVRGLAAVIAHRACSRWMRRQFPQRHVLKNRLHYLLTRGRSFALWPGRDGRLIAGFAAWRGQTRAVPAARFGNLSDNHPLLEHIESIKAGDNGEALARAIAAFFDAVGAPVEFDDLVSTLAGLLQITERPLESMDRDGQGAGFPEESYAAKTIPDTAWRIEKRIFLQRLWEEVGHLPLKQRAALLLNLRDAEGQGCIALFPATGIATLREIAAALEMPAEEFATLWNELPIDDARIAGLLGHKRQQVINARKSARERLSRRLRGFI